MRGKSARRNSFLKMGGQRRGNTISFRRKSQSNFSRKVRAVVMEQLTADNSIVANGAFKLSAGGAQQNMYIGNPVVSMVAGDALPGNGAMDDPYTIGKILQTIAATNTTKFTRKTHTVSYHMKNNTNTDSNLTEYRVVARKDIPLTINGNVRTLNDYLGTMGVGWGDNTAIAAPFATASNPTIFGTTPFQNPLFVEYFKIKKIKKYLIKGGAAKTLTYTYKKPKQYNAELMSNAENYHMLKGTSVSAWVIFGAIGAVVDGANSTIGLAATQLDCIMISRMHYSWINDNNNSSGASVGAVTQAVRVVADANPRGGDEALDLD